MCCGDWAPRATQYKEMGNRNLNAFFEMQVSYFERKDFKSLVQRIKTPLPVYSDGYLVIFHTDEEMMEGWSNTHKALSKDGYDHSDFRIVAHSLPRGQHMSIWVEWFNRDANGKVINRNFSRRFCRMENGRPVEVLLVEFLDHLPPDLAKNREMLAD